MGIIVGFLGLIGAVALLILVIVVLKKFGMKVKVK